MIKRFPIAAIDDAVERAIDNLNYDFSGSKKRRYQAKPLLLLERFNRRNHRRQESSGSVIRYVRERIGEDVKITVAEADASAMRTKYAFKILGYDELCQKQRC